MDSATTRYMLRNIWLSLRQAKLLIISDMKPMVAKKAEPVLKVRKRQVTMALFLSVGLMQGMTIKKKLIGMKWAERMEYLTEGQEQEEWSMDRFMTVPIASPAAPTTIAQTFAW